MVALSLYEWNMLLKLKVLFLLFRVKSLSHAFDLKFLIPYVGIWARGFCVHERILQVLLCLWLLWLINPQKVTTLKGDCWDLGLINKVHFRHVRGLFLGAICVCFTLVLNWIYKCFHSVSFQINCRSSLFQAGEPQNFGLNIAKND